MAYDEELVERVRKALAGLPKIEEKKMFGHLAFMVNEKMCVTVGNDKIMCRIDPATHDEMIKIKGCSTVIMREREYKGYVHVDKEILQTEADLAYWVNLVLEFNEKLTSYME
jgi:TfoX/Sxy family transcriptional regulator of competence genes